MALRLRTTRVACLAACLGAIAASACNGPPVDIASIYEAVFDEFGDVERGYYVLAQPGIPYSSDAAVLEQQLSGYEFSPAPSIHDPNDFRRVDVSWITKSEYDELFSSGVCEDDWSRFHQRYPDSDGLVTISPVGFGAVAGTAVVYVSGATGCLAGRGFLFYVERDNKHWVVSEVVRVRIE